MLAVGIHSCWRVTLEMTEQNEVFVRQYQYQYEYKLAQCHDPFCKIVA
jgi:hypothetical protein